MLRVVAGVVALVLTAGCGPSNPREPETVPTTNQPSASEPEQAVDDLIQALEAGDCAAARQVVVAPSQLECGVVEQAAGMFADAGIDVDATIYDSDEVQDDSVVVTITWDNGDPDESYDLQRIDAVWLVIFDSAA